MVRANGGGYAAVLFFPDEPELVRAVRAAAAGEPECAVVSPGAFEQMLADDFGGRFLKVLAAAAAGVLALAAFFFRSAALTFLAAVPAVTAMAVLGAVFALCGTALNLIVCFTGIMLAGLTIDYGIFAVYAAKEGRGSTLPAAMGISAATTVFGAAALLFSSHPVLFHTGFALVVGVSVACAAGLLVVPALWTLFKRRGWVAGALLAAVLLAGCRSDVFEAPEYPPLELSPAETAAELAEWNRTALPRFRAQANLSIEYWRVTVPALALVRGDLPAERLAAAGLAPAGAKVFEAAGAGGVLERWELAPYFPAATARRRRKVCTAIWRRSGSAMRRSRRRGSRRRGVSWSFRCRCRMGTNCVTASPESRCSWWKRAAAVSGKGVGGCAITTGNGPAGAGASAMRFWMMTLPGAGSWSAPAR